MIRTFTRFAVALVALIAIQSSVLAAGGTADEAKALAEKAAQLIQSQGKEKAFEAFNNPTGEFVDRDLYVAVTGLDGTNVAHGANKALIGKNLAGLKDVDGKPFVQEMVDLAKSTGSGWVDYKWSNPVSKKIEQKSSYIKRVGDVFVVVGIYKG